MLLLHRADARRRRGARHAGALHRRAGHAREHPYHYPVLHVLQEQRADRAARGTGGFVRRRARGTLTPTLLDRTEDRPWTKPKPPETPTPTSFRTTAVGRCSTRSPFSSPCTALPAGSTGPPTASGFSSPASPGRKRK